MTPAELITDGVNRRWWRKPPPADSDRPVIQRWLRGYVRQSVELALCEIADGADRLDAESEPFLLAAAACAECGWPLTCAMPAVQAELTAARETMQTIGVAIRRAIWPLIQTRAPGRDILATAHERAAAAAFWLPPQLVEGLCRNATAGASREAA